MSRTAEGIRAMRDVLADIATGEVFDMKSAQRLAEATLERYPIDPDAVARVMKLPEHDAICDIGNGPGRACDCGLHAALAKLEKP